MIRRVLSVTAPSRLHFGLFAFGAGHQTEFGGVGLMIDRPKTRLRFAPADRLELQVSNPSRVRQTIEKWFALRPPNQRELFGGVAQLPIQIRQVSGPKPHVGLGSGTQLTLAVAAGLSRWFNVSPELTCEDATQYGRAKRSAVGSHGFFSGGLIVDQGKDKSDSIGLLETRIELPREWRIVLVCPAAESGPSGAAEDQLFDGLPAVAPHEAEFLRAVVRDRLIPAAHAADYGSLCDAIYEFGYRAGLCYRSLQKGPFNGSLVSDLVTFIRSLGFRGTGQSSWGPCVFTLCESIDHANELIRALQSRFPPGPYWFEISTLNQVGHTVSECSNRTITMEQPVQRA